MFADRNCFKPAMKLFLGFVLAGSFLCARAPAQQLSSCDSTGGVQPCIPRFVDLLPFPPLFQATQIINGVDSYEIAARQISQQVLSSGAVDGSGNQLMTTVFAFGQNGFPYNPGVPTTVCAANGNLGEQNCFFYPGPEIAASTARPVHVKWFNDITCHTGDTFNSCTPGTFLPYPGVTSPGGVTPSFTNHTSNPTGICNGKAVTPSDCKGIGGYTGPVPFVVHLHGVDTTSESDGIPEAWNLPGNTSGTTYSAAKFPFGKGSDYCQQDPATFNTAIFPPRNCTYLNDGGSRYVYPNHQYGTLLFFHDHSLGVTTENVYMGLAGGYILRGTNTSGTFTNTFADDLPVDCSPSAVCADGTPSVPGGLPGAGIPAGTPVGVPLVITDKAFNTDGSLKFSENGNVIVVNGKTWPIMNVEPRKYRFRVVIAAPTSRFDLTFPSADNDHPGTPVATMTQIGADQGYLPHPATVSKVSLMPGERADVLVDFQQFFGCAPPFGVGCTVDLLNANGSGDTGTIMRFNIVPFATCDPVNNIAGCFPPTADTSCKLSFLSCTSADTLPHRGSEVATSTRQVSLFDDHLGNCTNPGCAGSVPLPWEGTVTETPTAGTTEVWEMYDFQDSHPMHLHLASFQVINRERISCVTNHTPCPVGPGPGETGFKDTVQANAGQITRVRVSFKGPSGEIHPGLFAWHCHINPHEDNEMMRPLCILYNDSNPAHMAADAACKATP